MSNHNNNLNLGEAIFINHLSNIQKLLENTTLRQVKKPSECKYTAVLIENRIDFKIETILLNLITLTNEDVGIQIFYNEENESYILPLIKKYSLDNVILSKITNFSFSSQYQQFLFSKEFYDTVIGEKILLFQIDSLLLKYFDYSYFDYDWVGALWNKETLQQPSLKDIFSNLLPIGNGGFNIRNIKKCRACAEVVNYTYPIRVGDSPYVINEDNAYSYLLQINKNFLNTKFPTIEAASSFAVETIYHEDPMAIHAFYKYFDYTKEQALYVKKILDRHYDLIKSLTQD